MSFRFFFCVYDSKEQNCLCISSTWIIDSGASEHIVFQSYFPFTPHILKNKKVKIVDGSFSSIVDQHTIKINPTLSLKSMLDVLNLSYSLLSIGKITKDLSCLVIFISFDCIFHDFVRGSMIGHAKEKIGL